MSSVGQNQLKTFTSPVNGPKGVDANAVRGNDNALMTAFNAHDADKSIHVQTGTAAARPTADGTQGIYITTDTKHLYIDTGSWQQIT